MTAEPRVAVYMLDVGQGDCTFVVGPETDAAPVLFDCGDSYVAERFVKDNGIKRLSAAIASHLDIDHIRGMLPFLRGFLAANGPGSVEAFHANIDQKPDPGLRRAAYLLMKRAVEWRRSQEIPFAGAFREVKTRGICGGATWSVELVLPHYAELTDMRLEDREQPNASSAVLRVSMGNHAILVGGDATLSSWEQLEDPLLRADVFRIPHHGGKIAEGTPAWTIADLYQRVAPKIAVISVGTNNRYAHPNPACLPMAPANGGSCRVLCTQLTPRCHDDPLALRARALKNPTATMYAYRHRVHPGDPRKHRPRKEVPCAGSMVVWLGPNGIDIVPGPSGWHDNFVDLLDQPLCRPPMA